MLIQIILILLPAEYSIKYLKAGVRQMEMIHQKSQKRPSGLSLTLHLLAYRQQQKLFPFLRLNPTSVFPIKRFCLFQKILDFLSAQHLTPDKP